MGEELALLWGRASLLEVSPSQAGTFYFFTRFVLNSLDLGWSENLAQLSSPSLDEEIAQEWLIFRNPRNKRLIGPLLSDKFHLRNLDTIGIRW